MAEDELLVSFGGDIIRPEPRRHGGGHVFGWRAGLCAARSKKLAAGANPDDFENENFGVWKRADVEEEKCRPPSNPPFHRDEALAAVADDPPSGQDLSLIHI